MGLSRSWTAKIASNCRLASSRVPARIDHWASSRRRAIVPGNDGLVETRAMTIWVGEPQRGGPGPAIPNFNAAPATVSLNNRCTTLFWTTTGTDITRVTLFRNGKAISAPGITTPYQDCVPDADMGRDILYELRVEAQASGWTMRQIRVGSVAG